MKQPFNNAGVSQKQAAFFALPMAQQAAEILHMLSDFAGWMEDNFLLSASQQEQIASMPEDFKNMLSTSIAESWEGNQAVRFDKQTRAEDDRPPKDIVIGQGLSTEGATTSTFGASGRGLYILIRYRPQL